MPPTLAQLGVLDLSIADRFALAQALWDSVHEALAGLPLEPGLRAELERRVARADADPAGGIPWEVVREQARARWQPK